MTPGASAARQRAQPRRLIWPCNHSAGARPAFADSIAPEEVVDRINAEIVEDWLVIPAAEARERYRRAHERLVEAIRVLPDTAWEAEVPPQAGIAASPRSLGDLLGETLEAPGYPFGHAFAHVDDVRAYARQLTGGD